MPLAINSKKTINHYQNMKAIVTKYMPATNHRGSRIKASSDGVKSMSIPYPHELSGEAVHKSAAIALCKRHGWTEKIIGGGMPDQSGYAFIFADQ